METSCKFCDSTGIAEKGTEFEGFCTDCVTGRRLAFTAHGSNLDPAKYPACQFENDPTHPFGGGPCDDSGMLKDGSPCDCDKASILGFESLGYSHEVAIKVMCALTSCDEGCGEPLHSLVDAIDEARDRLGLIGDDEAAGIIKLLDENPKAVQMALDNSWLREFL